MTLPGASRGIVVTTSHFSDGALAYAAELNAKSNGFRIELWDHDRLVSEARGVGVFLVTSRQGTSVFFEVPWRDDAKFSAALWQRHFRGIKSVPRPVNQAVHVEAASLEIVPVVAVDYRVDVPFETQVGLVYHAKEAGRVLFPLKTNLSVQEREFWTSAGSRSVEMTEDAKKRVAPLFGAPMSPCREQVAREVSQRLSKTVSYTGGNNVSYSKVCEVRPNQVETTSQQVLLARRRLAFSIGPEKYRATIADDAQRGWIVSSSEGFTKGEEGFLQGNGIICNDCGSLSPPGGDTAGLACQDCQRTLCQDHHWKWPSKTLHPQPSLCNTCYGKRAPQDHHLTPRTAAIRASWKAALLGLVPGLPFFLERRWLPAASLVLCTLALLAYQHANLTKIEAMGAIGSSISAASSFAWSRRIEIHERNLRALGTYSPRWTT
jgi:hypothetical protein